MFNFTPETTETTETMTSASNQIFFVPLSECKNKVITISWKFPYHKITKAGEDYGFFVATKSQPSAPAILKNRTWGYKRAQYKGLNGWYVYVKQFTNGFIPEDYVYIEASK
tara:strand:+ start:386 stop:718 length:333 start_codon:yes stop_codon:yes gene_type:complete